MKSGRRSMIDEDREWAALAKRTAAMISNIYVQLRQAGYSDEIVRQALKEKMPWISEQVKNRYRLLYGKPPSDEVH